MNKFSTAKPLYCFCISSQLLFLIGCRHYGHQCRLSLDQLISCHGVFYASDHIAKFFAKARDCEGFTLLVSRTRTDSRDCWFGAFQRGDQRLDVIGHLE